MARKPHSHASSQWWSVRTAMAASTAPRGAEGTSAARGSRAPATGAAARPDVARLDGNDVAIVRLVPAGAATALTTVPRRRARTRSAAQPGVLAAGPHVALADAIVSVAGRAHFTVSSDAKIALGRRGSACGNSNHFGCRLLRPGFYRCCKTDLNETEYAAKMAASLP